jgi:hypothetical protein
MTGGAAFAMFGVLTHTRMLKILTIDRADSVLPIGRNFTVIRSVVLGNIREQQIRRMNGYVSQIERH